MQLTTIKILFCATFMVLGIGLNSCGNSSKSESKLSNSKAKLTVKFKQSTTPKLLLGDAVGINNGTGIETLAYVLDKIQLFKEGTITTRGSAYTPSAPGWNLYNRTEGDLNYATFNAEAALAARPAFKNFLNQTDVDSLTQNLTLTEADIGKYSTASLSWFRPLWVKCSVTLSDGSNLYTKTPLSFLSTGEGLNTTVKTLINDMGTAPSQETVAMLPNGGTFSSFGKPFEITASDIWQSADFKMILAFRPEGMCQGLSMNSQTSGIKWANHTNAAMGPNLDQVPTIQLKFLDIIPIVAKKGQVISRDSYTLKVKTAVDPTGASITNGYSGMPAVYATTARFLMDVYRVGTDDIRGVNFTATTPVGGNSVALIAPYKPTSVSFDDGKISGLDWAGAKVVDKFAPLTEIGAKQDLIHETCIQPSSDFTTCITKGNVVFEAELIEKTDLDTN